MEEILYSSRLFDVLRYPGPAGTGHSYERVRRSPGVRVLIGDEDEQIFVVSSEHREEVGGIDMRLPGGKVIDAVADAATFWTLPEADKVVWAEAAGRREVEEELGLAIGALELLDVVPCGATIEWDLYVFLARGWQPIAEGPRREVGEESIEAVVLTADALWDAIHTGAVSEGRSAQVVGRHLYPRYSMGARG